MVVNILPIEEIQQVHQYQYRKQVKVNLPYQLLCHYLMKPLISGHEPPEHGELLLVDSILLRQRGGDLYLLLEFFLVGFQVAAVFLS